MKKVEFQGLTYEVPDWANWITKNVSRGGEIRVFENKPTQDESSFYDWGRSMQVFAIKTGRNPNIKRIGNGKCSR